MLSRPAKDKWPEAVNKHGENSGFRVFAKFILEWPCIRMNGATRAKDWILTMSEVAKERTYSEAEIKTRLEQELPRWVYEGGWIRRTYRTTSWKGTLMVINTVGHLAEAAWHHPDLTASYAWVEVRLQNHAAKGITDKDFELAKKIEEVVLWQPGKAGGALEGTPSDQRFAYIDYKKS
jgi:4a-hydroxytetrahydrobiopterin dehydratase